MTAAKGAATESKEKSFSAIKGEILQQMVDQCGKNKHLTAK